jgi:hypothetical protein
MAANATTKIQVNYGKDGILVNVYADNQGELETLLASVQDLSSLINSVNGSLRSLPAPVVASAPTVESVAQQFNAPAAPAPVVVEGQAPTCSHGTMAFRNGTSARGPWRAWMCAAPKGAVDKCEAIFLR